MSHFFAQADEAWYLNWIAESMDHEHKPSRQWPAAMVNITTRWLCSTAIACFSRVTTYHARSRRWTRRWWSWILANFRDPMGS